jgi:hypothetical protein
VLHDSINNGHGWCTWLIPGSQEYANLPFLLELSKCSQKARLQELIMFCTCALVRDITCGKLTKETNTRSNLFQSSLGLASFRLLEYSRYSEYSSSSYPLERTLGAG